MENSGLNYNDHDYNGLNSNGKCAPDSTRFPVMGEVTDDYLNGETTDPCHTVDNCIIETTTPISELGSMMRKPRIAGTLFRPARAEDYGHTGSQFSMPEKYITWKTMPIVTHLKKPRDLAGDRLIGRAMVKAGIETPPSHLNPHFHHPQGLHRMEELGVNIRGVAPMATPMRGQRRIPRGLSVDARRNGGHGEGSGEYVMMPVQQGSHAHQSMSAPSLIQQGGQFRSAVAAEEAHTRKMMEAAQNALAPSNATLPLSGHAGMMNTHNQHHHSIVLPVQHQQQSALHQSDTDLPRTPGMDHSFAPLTSPRSDGSLHTIIKDQEMNVQLLQDRLNPDGLPVASIDVYETRGSSRISISPDSRASVSRATSPQRGQYTVSPSRHHATPVHHLPSSQQHMMTVGSVQSQSTAPIRPPTVARKVLTPIDYTVLENKVKLKCSKCKQSFSRSLGRNPYNLSCGHFMCKNCLTHANGFYKTRKCATCNSICHQPFIENLVFLDFQDQYLKMLNKMKNGDPMEDEDNEVEILGGTEESTMQCSQCEKETKMSKLRECWRRPCEKYHKPVCWICVASTHSEHITTPYSPNANHLAVYQSHKLIDISRFPDRRFLDVQGIEFDVSASFLATHSTFFNDMFYGSIEKRSQTHFELDEDPWIFVDLLDIMMMKRNKSKCCNQCDRTMEVRERMAKRLELMHVLNQPTSIKKGVYGLRPGFRVNCDIPDARFMRIGSTRFLVSSSTLSLFSPHFMNLFHKEENEIKDEVIFDLSDDCVVFAELLEVVNGSIHRGISPDTLSLLDKLDRLDAVFWTGIKTSEYDRLRLVKVVEGIMQWKNGKNDLTDEEIMMMMKLLDEDEISCVYEKITKDLRRRIKRLRGEEENEKEVADIREEDVDKEENGEDTKMDVDEKEEEEDTEEMKREDEKDGDVEEKNEMEEMEEREKIEEIDEAKEIEEGEMDAGIREEKNKEDEDEIKMETKDADDATNEKDEDEENKDEEMKDENEDNGRENEIKIEEENEEDQISDEQRKQLKSFINVHVQDLTGGRSNIWRVRQSTTVEILSRLVKARGYPDGRFEYYGTQLEPSKRLFDYEIADGTVILLR